MTRRTSREELEAIIAHDMPDHELVGFSSTSPPESADEDQFDDAPVDDAPAYDDDLGDVVAAPVPRVGTDADSLGGLYRQSLRAQATMRSQDEIEVEDDEGDAFHEFFPNRKKPKVSASVDAPQPDVDANGVTIVTVRPKNENPLDTAAARPKAVVVSVNEKRVIGKQG